MKETGKMHGVVRMITPKGAIEEGMYKNGRRHGMVRNIPTNGEHEIYNWCNGQRHGLQTVYREDGSIKYQDECRQGK